MFGHTACNLFTTVEQQFGSALDVLHNRTVGFLDAGEHVFCLGRKRLLAHYLGAVAQQLVVEAHRVEPHQQGTFRRVADGGTLHGERCRAVDADAKGKFLAVKVSKEPMLDHRHAVLRQRARLVGADHRRSTHRLAGMQLAHQVVFLQHLAHAQGKAHGDAHRQSLGHSHHNQRDGKHHRLQDETEDNYRLILVGHVTKRKIIKQTAQDNQQGDGKTCIRNPASQLVQLAAERCLHFRTFARQSHATTLFAIHRRLVNHIDAVAFDHRAATQHTIGRIGRLGVFVIVLLVGCELILIRFAGED